MRIRKRLPPPPPPPPPSPPLSPPSLSSSPSRAAPLSVSPDPHPKSGGDDNILRAAVQEAANPRWGFLTSTQLEEDKIEDEGCDTTSPRGESITLAAELITSMRYSSHAYSSATVAAGSRGEGDKTVLPLKKRKGGFESSVGATSKEGALTSNSSSMKEEMKSKTNKKCLLQNGYGKEAEYDEEEKKISSSCGGGGGGSKKSKRGGVIMEGSRCSRVNGRGWRCSQPTLVGYSLCEHHLGKGRLRSLNSARNKSRMAAARASGGGDHQQKPQKTGARVVDPGNDRVNAPLQVNQQVSKNMDSDEETEEKKMKPLAQKRMKLGAVKARSMSSLLGQMDVDNKEVAIPNNIGGIDLL